MYVCAVREHTKKKKKIYSDGSIDDKGKVDKWEKEREEAIERDHGFDV